MYPLLPLLAAFAFAFGSMVFKPAYAEGAGVTHAVVVNNLIDGMTRPRFSGSPGLHIPWRAPCIAWRAGDRYERMN